MIDDEGRLHLWVGEEVVMLTAEEFRENNRKVAEVAWDEGFDVGANTEEGIDTNPYRAKGATND